MTWPGQATGYKIGQMKIRELKALAETRLGDKFNIKDFHEVGFRHLVLNLGKDYELLNEKYIKG